MATAAFKEAYLELVPQFERATGHKVVTTWASNSDVVARVQAGEATDLMVMSADAVDKLIAAGKVPYDGRTDIATSWVAAAVKQGAPRPDISSAEAFKQSMLAAKSIAYSFGPSGVSSRSRRLAWVKAARSRFASSVGETMVCSLIECGT